MVGIQERRLPLSAYALVALAKADKLYEHGIQVGGLVGDYEAVFF